MILRKFFFVFLIVLSICSLQIFALAEEFDSYSSDLIINDEEPILVGDRVVYPSDLEPILDYVPPDDFVSVGVADPALDGAITNVSVMSLNPVTPSDTSGLKAVLLELIGDYDAVVVEYEYQSSNGYSNYLREVQPDYVWLCSCGLFAIVIYCLFRLGGALLRD